MKRGWHKGGEDPDPTRVDAASGFDPTTRVPALEADTVQDDADGTTNIVRPLPEDVVGDLVTGAEATLDREITAATPPPIVVVDPNAVEPILPRGTVLGDYEIENVAGEGGMGTVYRAVHPVIGKRAAIKVIKQALCADPSAVSRFLDEARVVNQIKHPNIVDVFAFGRTADGRSYLAMEWLDGESLAARLAKSRLLLDEVCEIVRPLARALMAAHAKNVIHRDLKPDNIFLVRVPGEPSLVKLLDFGIAKLANTEHRIEQTASGALIGTPLYMSPEQAKGPTVDARSDIYSLGAILFELVTGRRPFVANSAIEVIAKHLMEEPPRPSAFATIPRPLDDLIVAMLAKDPERRPLLSRVCDVVERTKDIARETIQMDARESFGSLQVTKQRQATPLPVDVARFDPRRFATPKRAIVPIAIGIVLVIVLSALVCTSKKKHDGVVPDAALTLSPSVSLDAAADVVSGDAGSVKSKANSTSLKTNVVKPAGPAADEIATAMDAIGRRAAGCYLGAGGVTNLSGMVEPTGRISTVKMDRFTGTPTGTCVENLVKDAVRFGAWQGAAKSFEYSLSVRACDVSSCGSTLAKTPCCAWLAMPETLERAGISVVIDGAEPRVRSCTDKSGARGKQKFKVTVNAAGAVTTVERTSVGDAALGACIEAIMKALTFAKTRNGDTFNYDFTL